MRILVCDDEKIISGALARVLSRAGHEVLVANHGTEAIRLVESAAAAFDCCFVDLLMPEISGSAVLDMLRHRMPSAKVFMMTAYGDHAVREDLVRRGACRVLSKPFDDITRIPELISGI